MTAPVRVDAVLFDYGGVLTSSLLATSNDWIEKEKIASESLRLSLATWLGDKSAPDNPLANFERGDLSQTDFERAFAAALIHQDGTAVSADGLLDRLFASVTLEEQSWAIARGLRSRGIKVGVLSNSWGDRYPRRRLSETFDDVVISAEVGMRKPDPEIYRLAAARLGVDPQRCVFIDDLGSNLTGAAAVGMTTVLHRAPQATHLELTKLGLLSVRSNELAVSTEGDAR